LKLDETVCILFGFYFSMKLRWKPIKRPNLIFSLLNLEEKIQESCCANLNLLRLISGWMHSWHVTCETFANFLSFFLFHIKEFKL
jgi:hypothetical protein